MYLHEVLIDIRLALAVAIFCAGGAAATFMWMLLYMIGEYEKKKNDKMGKKGRRSYK